MFSIDGKVVVVTGGAAGIGRGIVQALAGLGARVVVGDVDLAALDALVADVQGEVVPCRCDVTSAANAEALVRTAVDTFGRLDALINNAGIEGNGTVVECSEDTWERVMRVNVSGAFLCSKYAVPALQNAGGGAIVNTASVSGFWGESGTVPYNASKGALIGMTRAMAMDHGRDRIRVNAVCPGYHATGMPFRYFHGQDNGDVMARAAGSLTAMNRFGEPDELGNLYAFLVSDANPYITGAVLVADGGMTAGYPWHEA